MKVYELIERLSKLDPELDVCVYDASEWCGPLASVEVDIGGRDDGYQGPSVYLTRTCDDS